MGQAVTDPSMVEDPTTAAAAAAAAAAATTTMAAETTTLSTRDELNFLIHNSNSFFLIVNGIIVFLMQGGFAFLEAGAVRLGVFNLFFWGGEGGHIFKQAH